MSDETKPEPTMSPVALVTEAENPPSSVFHISIRGWAAIMLVGTICWMSVMQMEIREPLNNMGMVAIGFLFARVSSAK